MTFQTRKTKILYTLPNVKNFEQGQKFTLNQGISDDSFDNPYLTDEEREDIKNASYHLGRKIVAEEAKQNAIGLLFNEYYGRENEFAKNGKLVTELQRNLKILDYNLGDSGENKDGVDGDLGTKTKTAIGNFEQDNLEAIKAMAEQKAAVQEAVKGKVR